MYKRGIKMKEIAFVDWLSKIFAGGLPDGIVAFCFNLYESEDENQFDVQLVGCPEFDEENEDWACNEVFSTGEDLFPLRADDWEDALRVFSDLLDQTLKEKRFDSVFGAKHIAFGFVDGDLTLKQ